MTLFYRIPTNGLPQECLEIFNAAPLYKDGLKNLLVETCTDLGGDRREPLGLFQDWIFVSTAAKRRLWPELNDEKKSNTPTKVHYFGLTFLTSDVVFEIISYGVRLPPDNLFFVQPEEAKDTGDGGAPRGGLESSSRWKGVYGDILILLERFSQVVNFPREVFVLLEEHLRNFFVVGRQRRPMLTLSKKGKLKVEFLIRDGEGRYRGKDGWAV